MKCIKMEEWPVINEWQTVYCPNCQYYYCGKCNNPTRKNNMDPCPIEVKNKFKFKIYQNITVKPQNIKGKIINRMFSRIGCIYEIITGENKFWIAEKFLEN